MNVTNISRTILQRIFIYLWLAVMTFSSPVPTLGAARTDLDGTTLGISGTRFTINGRPTFLYGISYYAALGAREDFVRADLDDMQSYGFNWIRVWATWSGFSNDVSAVNAHGAPREIHLHKLKTLVAECDRRGMVVDVTFSRGDGRNGSPHLIALEAHRRAIETVVTALKPWRNWYLDLSNERNIGDARFASIEDLTQLRELARRLDHNVPVTASQGGDIGRDELRDYLQKVRVDFITPHRPRDRDSPAQTEAKTREYLKWMKEIGRVVPVHYQEPLRRGYASWNPTPDDFATDLRGAIIGGAAGWCFHNGSQRGVADAQPRRSFDLREKRLFDQLDDEEREAIERMKPIVAGAKAELPYPPSPLIRRIVWAPTNEIVRLAKGSDNWPLTWAENDALYTAYGDGRGFSPFVKDKLSLGLAKVLGHPPDITGLNLRSPSAEATGDGKRGRKASGLLMVDNVLYLFVRNVGNSQLAWSADHGTSWTWADWKFTTSFGCPTFLNFGRNYAGARDDFVYVYSHDSDSAYDRADRMVLARVPKDKLRQRDAYEFFVRLDKRVQPAWSHDISKRGTIFNNPGQCYRSSISYSAPLKRYLWCQTGRGTDTRFTGGFAIYDAPEPWGPWTTAFHTDQWDVGPGDTCHLTPKWMSDDGRTVWLVFSGDDSFSIRKGILEVAP